MKKPTFKLSFYKNFEFLWIPSFSKGGLMWKDKWNMPRCESEPHFTFEWLWFGIRGVWGDDGYWEQWLWVHRYHNGDVAKAKEKWGWTNMKTGKSTWVDY